MSKKINIIGAGLAGLAAGCYLEMNGYDTQIFELHTLPGGLCTSWKRGDYIFDGCVDYFVGANPASGLYHIWNELIDMKQLELFHYDEYRRFEDKNGQFIRVLTNLDEFEKEMLEKAPEDKEAIAEFIGLAKKFLAAQEMPPDHPDNMDLEKWNRIQVSELSKKCKNPLLEKTIGWIFAPDVSVSFVMSLLAWMHTKDAAYPIGGSLQFSRLFEKRYLDLGGAIHYNSRVKKILTKDNSATGVMLGNGETYPADIVVSAADGYSTIFKMLEGKYTDEKLLNIYENAMPTPPYLIVSLGISRTFPEVPHRSTFPLEKALQMAPGSPPAEEIRLRVFDFDPTAAPEGKTVISCSFSPGDYKYWVDLRENDREAYNREKKRIADEVIDTLEKRYGDIKTHVEVIDVCTPATVIRYTGNWQGSMLGWWLTEEDGTNELKNTLPGLENFYMAGQWVDGGGLPSAILSGRKVAEIICKNDKKEFTTSHF